MDPDEDGRNSAPKRPPPSTIAEGQQPRSEPASTAPTWSDIQEKYGRLEQKVRHRTMALATVAHELKTPLAIVSGYINLLLGEKVGQLNDRQRQILKDSLSNCARLEKFVHDFLAFSAIDKRKDRSQDGAWGFE